MKYFLLFLFCLSLQTVFAQDENRRAAAQAQVADSATFAALRFEARLTRLHEALDKNDASSSVSCYANLLGDIRSAIETEEKKAPGSERLASMQGILEKLGTFTFDPMKPGELKPYLPYFDDFLKLLR